ncbi:hypothetical protein PENANT_c017G03679 [Penicillium antarcticum]|uniref:Transcription factor domain-containing protein n=1 Tax=Penicillium antarcticum TaxID=416450 RepID=A0A1V6Q298_9EURO|nr:hypothetical protein PENANT_c017G03679 [Penicillium antarcticum]
MPWGLAPEDLSILGTSPVDTLFDPCPPQKPSPTWQDLLNLSPGSHAVSEASMSNNGSRNSLHFLDKFTSNTGLVMSFDCGTHEQREQVAASIEQEILSQVPQATASGFNILPDFGSVVPSSSILDDAVDDSACVSPDMPDNEDARTWLNCVEEMVFIDDDFNSELSYSHSGSMSNQKRKIQALQAAYIVCLYQNWEGTDASKRRIRRYRFATLVSTARDIGIATARHQNYSEKGRPEFEWREFAAREELIRVFTWIFLLDTAFVIFNNLPPRMVIKEMRMHMAMPETCFQATTADQCHQQIQYSLPVQSLYWKFSFRGAFESLCRDDLSLEVRHMVSSLGPLVLFALASAIHSQIFQFRSAVGSFQLLAPISNALSNWRDIWQTFSLTSCRGVLPFITIEDINIQPEHLWRRMGFYRYAPEYWLLANLMADRLAVLGTSQPESELELLDEDT